MASLKEIEYWYSEVITQPKADRLAFLQVNLSHRPELLSEVETLVRSDENEESLLTQLRVKLKSGVLEEPEQRPTVDRYTLYEEMGRGGMSVVYRAVRDDGVFDQQVAVKVLKRGMDTDDIVRRFQQERNVLGRLKHPNIAQIYDGGVTSDGRPYFVMELVEGDDLIRYCQKNKCSTSEKLFIFQSVCKAVSFAHQNLIIHRDIKPSNVLVGKDEDVKLMDFGIAKLISPENDDNQTQEARNILTPRFASPEQISDGAMDIRSDVYQLGKILQLLTNGMDTPADVRAIIQKAIREEKEARYDSVSDMKDDIQNFLEGRPVLARNGKNGYVLKKFVSRNKVTISSLFLALTVLVGISIAYVVGLKKANEEIQQEKRIAEGSLNAFLDIFSQAYPSYAKGDTLNIFDLLDIGDSLLSAKTEERVLYVRYLSLMGEIYSGYHQDAIALKYYRRAYKIYENSEPAFRKRNSHLLHSFMEIGKCFVALNQIDSAYYYLDLLEKKMGLIDQTHSQYALSDFYGNLAWIEANNGNYEKAILNREKALSLAKKGGEPYSIAMSMARLARLLADYDNENNKNRIDSLLNETILLFKENKLSDTRKNDYATVLNYLGMYFYYLQELDSAAHYFKKSYHINLEYFGNENLMTLDNLNNLAGVQIRKNEIIEARKNFLKCWKTANSIDLPYTSSLNYYQNYATTFNLTQEYSQAEFKLDSLLDFRLKKLPNQINEINHARTKLATAAIGLNKYEKAESLLNQIISDHLRVMGENGVNDLFASIRLIKLKLLQGDTTKALEIQKLNHHNIVSRLGKSSIYLAANDTLVFKE